MVKMKKGATGSLIDRAGLLVLALSLLVGVRECRGETPFRITTYNVRFFGREPTNIERLAQVVAAAEPTVFALQELVDNRALHSLLSELARTGHRYEAVTAQCGGRSGLRVAFVYDTSRVGWEQTREYPGLEVTQDGSCTDGDRAALAGTFYRLNSRGMQQEKITLVTVHLAAFATDERVAQRRAQWKKVFAIVDHLKQEVGGSVMVLGDTNSTGWLTDTHGERSYIVEQASQHQLQVQTAGLLCSEYYMDESKVLVPSLLDHILAPQNLVNPASVRVHGYCAEQQCRALGQTTPPLEYRTVSDHCPVSVELRAR